MTKPGASIVVGNFHVAMAGRAYLDYWMNWPLIYRDEAAMLRLVSDDVEVEAHVAFEATGSQMFLTLERVPAPTPT